MAIQNLGNEHTLLNMQINKRGGSLKNESSFTLPQVVTNLLFFFNILQNIIFCVQQKKEMYRDFALRMSKWWQIFHF